MSHPHHYSLNLKWTGNKGDGTTNYRSYDRSHLISIEGKSGIAGSSDPVFRGDKTKYNPEELLVAALSACHMLSYLHLCSEAGVNVIDYVDNATGTMEETPNGGGKFTEVVLYPTVTVSDESMVTKANQLHHSANELCFIANSCNFPVRHQPSCIALKAVSLQAYNERAKM
ncbi:MAG: OsmC family protein [Segetibacter sp.]|jgi:organic hydroperoxide reductase OsmC/OhrA|nr:OsmC family protein [Segetibacter sp.]